MIQYDVIRYASPSSAPVADPWRTRGAGEPPYVILLLLQSLLREGDVQPLDAAALEELSTPLPTTGSSTSDAVPVSGGGAADSEPRDTS